MQPDTLSILNRLFVRETHTLLQYLNDAWPWISAEEQPVLNRLKKIAAYEKESLIAIADYLNRHRTPPGLGRFPDHFTSMHFLGLDHLLPRLESMHQVAIASIEGDLRQIADAEASNLVEELLARKRRHLQDIHALAVQYAGGKAPSTRR